MRFVEEYAVEWARSGQFGQGEHFNEYWIRPKTFVSESTRTKEEALAAIEMLSKRREIILARLISRTVREEKRWWERSWTLTGMTRWFDWDEEPWSSGMKDVEA